MNEDDIAKILARTVQVGCGCLKEIDREPGVCTVYHGAGGPLYNWCDDTWTVWLERANYSRVGQFPAPFGGSLSMCNDAVRTVAIAGRLRRRCWPIVTTHGMPSTDEAQDRSLELATDLSALLCCLTEDLTGRTSTILGERPGPGSLVTAPAATPDPNEGGRAGFTIRFAVGFG